VGAPAVDTMASVPLAVPVDVPEDPGANVTVNVTLAFGASEIGKVSPLTEKPAPLMFAAEMVTLAALVFVRLSVMLELPLFATLPNESVGDDATRPAAVFTPVEDGADAVAPQPLRSAIPIAISEISEQRCTCRGSTG
jgi:hypothetical protein